MNSFKGKEKDRDSFEEDTNSSGTPSLFSRVVTSANALAGSILTPPNNTELRDTTEAAAVNSGKGHSSNVQRSENSSWPESSRSAQIRTSKNEPHGIREGHSQEHMNLSEQEFSSFLDGAGSLLSNEPLNNTTPLDGIDPLTGFNLFAPLEGPYRPIYTKRGIDIMASLADLNREILEYKGPGLLEFTSSGFEISALRNELLEGIEQQDLQNTAKKPLKTREINPTEAPSLSIAEQESQDGVDVVTILSSPSREEFEVLGDNQESLDWGLSPKQIDYLRSITKDILVTPQHHGVPPQNPLNLVPEFDNPFWEVGQNQREQWHDVLTSYTDEVWGDLLPLVKQARVEIKEMVEDKSVPAPESALRRLQAILGHLQYKSRS